MRGKRAKGIRRFIKVVLHKDWREDKNLYRRLKREWTRGISHNFHQTALS